MASSNETLTVPSPSSMMQNSPTSPSIGIKNLSLHGRHHSLGASSSMHRVSRRKSVSSNSTNLAAVAQAVKEAGELPFTILPPAATILSKSVGRNSIGMGNGGPGLLSAGGQRGSIPSIHGYPSPPSSLPTNGAPSSSNIGSLPSSGFTFPRKLPVTPENGPSAITHGVSSSQGVSVSRRTRRASEGAHALLGGGGSTPGESGGKGGVELKCEKCGKGYKHSSCLTKHLWEHTPEWALTSKLLISKHQQVQLLEAASILVSMKPEDTPAPSNTSSSNSVIESATNNNLSSSNSSSEDTTPPPDFSSPLDIDIDVTSPLPSSRSIRARSGSKRYSSSSNIAGSYSSRTSAPIHSPVPPIISGSVPTHPSSGSSFPSHFVSRPHNHGRQRSGSFVNTSRVAAVASAAADEDSLAAAVELLSCSFGATAPIGSVGTPILTPHAGRSLANPPTFSIGRTPTEGTAPMGFLEQLRKQARINGNLDGDVVMKIEETEEEEIGWGSGRQKGTGSGMRRKNNDEMAIDDDDDEEEWRAKDARTLRSRSIHHAPTRRGKSEEDEEGVFGRMEE